MRGEVMTVEHGSVNGAGDHNEILDVLAPTDQTLTHYGLTRDELRLLATSGRLRGIDRMVPIGQALRFSHHWDGLDLLRAFSRSVFIES
jgi:hypothetical protein